MPATNPADAVADELDRELSELRGLAQDVAACCLLAADEFDATGNPPSEDVLAKCESLTDRLARCRGALRTHLEEVGGDSSAVGEDGFSALEQGLDALRNLRQARLVREAAVTEARSLLRAAQHLRHSDEASYPPLEKVRQLCLELEFQLGSEAWESPATALRDSAHPLRALLELVVDSDRLDDGQWATRQECVTAEFGRQLAASVARGRIVLGAEEADLVRDVLSRRLE